MIDSILFFLLSGFIRKKAHGNARDWLIPFPGQNKTLSSLHNKAEWPLASHLRPGNLIYASILRSEVPFKCQT